MWKNWSRAEAEAVFARWTQAEPERRRELHELAARTDGPALDGTLDSLRPLNVWLLERSREAMTDATPGRPEWVWSESTRIPDSLRRLTDLAATYVADVLRAQEPGAHWVCFSTTDSRDDRNGLPMLDLGWPANPVDVFVAANGGATSAVVSGREFDPDAIRESVDVILDQLATFRARSGG
ncbi:hypothetical protein [Cellulomonas sp.]|uniref:hypothetical protein n=1 Tax=Cellulomonas sp. TaxID=40001 RepID=UPI003BA8DC26